MNKKLWLERARLEIQAIDPLVVANAIHDHFEGRGRLWPTIEDGLLWIVTEIGECFELLSSKKAYIRNNPQDKEPYSKERFAEELGDIIYMAMITGMVEEVNPLYALLEKMEKQIDKEIDEE